MEKDESTAALMQALRGTNINDDDFAASGSTMSVVEMRSLGDSLPLDYDPPALSAYFAKRPGAVITRVLQVLSVSGGWLASVAFEALRGQLTPGSEAEVQAVARLRGVLVSLGPFFIKLGQALSIRPDILSPKAMVQLQQLCDKVPPFDSGLAMQTVRDDLDVADVAEIYSKITAEPVAAASLGQVYRATLRATGEEVAVKVQRPFVLETVSLDLHLARLLGLALRNTPISQRLDVVDLLDEFAARFYQELDYERECANGIRVAQDMRKIPRVVIPKNYPEFTSRRVHTAQWVTGEKLSQSQADDVGELVNLGVVTYLTQLLDTGFFHADPHPGNMLRTAEGELVILDFGLMTEVTDNQKYGMIEAIAHLINRDYEYIGEDFVNLEFIPKGVDTRPIVPALARVFDAALAGGGAKSINFQELAADLAEITFKFPFRIPPYFALIIRAISVLEGIALVGNPQFAIVDEAYPYISKRLLTDDSPRLRAALRYMVYGKSQTFDVDRMIDLLQALENNPNRLTPDGAAAEEAARAREALTFFFSREGEVFRTFLLDEVVNAADALSREAFTELTLTPAFSALSRLPAPPGARALLRALAPPLTEKDQKVVASIRKLTDFFLGNLDVGGVDALANARSNNPAVLQNLAPSAQSLQRARALLPVLADNREEMTRFGLQIVGRLTEMQAARALSFARDAIAARA
ncbi:hypothetical protein Ctob_008322 [Chrysochromulina tobinii]|uniref:Protein kinase domain-containing protein n=1 Tax=Chrysochromulina tobinii TaxID=1460289 RepID=A0A0M0JNM8_9EUKA|nr:hypothetical protein Ctob_008322 [Chrysochromulina tobinii]|eukprot:KOO28189.1 hypothetical protein Ctob_008322 [Chrysochromulina sp. CCMP291]